MKKEQQVFVIIPFLFSVILITFGVVIGNFVLLDVVYPPETEPEIIILPQLHRVTYDRSDGGTLILNSSINFQTFDVLQKIKEALPP